MSETSTANEPDPEVDEYGGVPGQGLVRTARIPWGPEAGAEARRVVVTDLVARGVPEPVVDESELVREAAVALGSMHTSGPDLVVACRRIVERHAEIGPLWWLCARLLTSSEPTRLAWQIADEVESDPTSKMIAAALPDDATVVTIGSPAVSGAALMRRGDARVLCADSRHEA